MMDIKRGYCSVSARAVLDDDGFSKRGTKLVADDAANRVAGAARAKHGNDGDRP